ncbi:phosphoglycerate kinase, partial [Saccharothrix sp. MB29]|nr:phosphoglycerate kinase [Saccharothrix sp. MB29]
MKTLDGLLSEGVSGRRVLVRAALYGPRDGARNTDAGRVRAAVPTG